LPHKALAIGDPPWDIDRDTREDEARNSFRIPKRIFPDNDTSKGVAQKMHLLDPKLSPKVLKL
jgi:hypothetical protein